jgi:hypothetical protein
MLYFFGEALKVFEDDMEQHPLNGMLIKVKCVFEMAEAQIKASEESAHRTELPRG